LSQHWIGGYPAFDGNDVTARSWRRWSWRRRGIARHAHTLVTH